MGDEGRLQCSAHRLFPTFVTTIGTNGEMKSFTLRLAAALLAVGACGGVQALERLVIFGESTSETGNTLILTGQTGQV